jgi:hypothetical protein
MVSQSADFRLGSTLRNGEMICSYDAKYDVVTLAFENVVLETEADVAWWMQSCDAFWKRFDVGKPAHERKDLLVDMAGLVVKPAVAAAWNAARARLVAKYLRNTYRYGGERRTVTAVHLGQVLQKVDGTFYVDREEALAALLADRAAAKMS